MIVTVIVLAATQVGRATGILGALADHHQLCVSYLFVVTIWLNNHHLMRFVGQPEGLTRDDVLDNATLTWLTDTTISGVRLAYSSS